MPEQDGIPDRTGGGVGSVAEETARLLEALLGPAPVPPEAASPEVPAPEAPADDAPSAGPCPTCGHTPQGTTHRSADVCHLCPVCQVLRVVRSVRPETLDRLADLAAAVTESLRDAAADRWRAAAPGDPAPPPARSPVQDIVVADSDDDDQADDDDAANPTQTDDLEDLR